MLLKSWKSLANFARISHYRAKSSQSKSVDMNDKAVQWMEEDTDITYCWALVVKKKMWFAQCKNI